MVAFVVRFSNLMFCDIWSSFSTQNDPFILKHYPLIVTVIVYGVPGIEVSVFNWVITTLSAHRGAVRGGEPPREKRDFYLGER